MAEPHRFTHNHGEELQFHYGRVAPDTVSAFLFEGRAPVHVFKGVAVGIARLVAVVEFNSRSEQTFDNALARYIKLTGSISTVIETSSGRESEASKAARRWLNLVICRVRNIR